MRSDRLFQLNHRVSKNEGSGTTLATHRRLTEMFLGSKAAHETMISKGAAPAGLDMHGWAQKAKAIGRKCEKPWENQGFTSGEDRNRAFACFPCVFEEFERYHSPSTLPLKTTRNRFPLASVCSVVPTFPASVCSVCSVVPCSLGDKSEQHGDGFEDANGFSHTAKKV